MSAAEACSVPRPVARLWDGELSAVIVRGLVPSASLRAAHRALEANALGFHRTEFPRAFGAFFYGENLNLADPADLPAYFAREPAFRRRLDRLPLGGRRFEELVAGALSDMDDGRPYRAAPGPRDGLRHQFTTLRAHGPGGYIPLHFDNEQAVRPSYRHVAARTQPRIASFVFCFAAPEAGGELEVFDRRAEAHGADFVNHDGAGRRTPPEGAESVSIRLEPGDMAVVDSGNLLHRVTPVRGARTRWTACSFMSPTLDGRSVLCWG